jgi:hypothetical protein
MTTNLLPRVLRSGSLWAVALGADELQFPTFQAAKDAAQAVATGRITWDDLCFDLGVGYDVGCECELDWRCGLHAGMHTPLELLNDAFASSEVEPYYGGLY